MKNYDYDAEDRAAEADRKARPYVVGEVEYPGVIERFATAQEAEHYINTNFNALEVAQGKYYIDGPE